MVKDKTNHYEDNPYKDIQELQDDIDNLGQRPSSGNPWDAVKDAPEGKVISIRSEQKLSPEESKALAKELSDINKHIKDVELLKEGFALMTKRHKYYVETKEMLEIELEAQGELWERRDQLEKKLLSQKELDEIFVMRSKKMESLEVDALVKVRQKIKEQERPEETALVPQPKQEVEKHKDWGAWRPPLKQMSRFHQIFYIPIGLPVDIVNWTYRKLKRLMGKGAELDGTMGKSQKFNYTGGGGVETSGEQEKFGFHVGQELRIKEAGVDEYFDSNYKKRIKEAKSLVIVGFTKEGNKIIIQVDGGGVIENYINDFLNNFEPIPETPEEKESETFTSYAGEKIRSTGEQKKDGLRVGQELFFKTPSLLSEEIYPEYYHAKTIKIAGFTGRSVIIQFDGSKVNDIPTLWISKYFKKIPEKSADGGTDTNNDF